MKRFDRWEEDHSKVRFGGNGNRVGNRVGIGGMCEGFGNTLGEEVDGWGV